MATARAAAAKRKRKQPPKEKQLPLLAPGEASEDQPQNSEPEQPLVPKEEPVKEAAAATTRRAKRVKAPKSADEPEFFPEQRNLVYYFLHIIPTPFSAFHVFTYCSSFFKKEKID